MVLPAAVCKNRLIYSLNMKDGISWSVMGRPDQKRRIQKTKNRLQVAWYRPILATVRAVPQLFEGRPSYPRSKGNATTLS